MAENHIPKQCPSPDPRNHTADLTWDSLCGRRRLEVAAHCAASLKGGHVTTEAGGSSDPAASRDAALEPKDRAQACFIPGFQVSGPQNREGNTRLLF